MDEETNEYFDEVDENHESDNDMTSEDGETEPEPNGTPTTGNFQHARNGNR